MRRRRDTADHPFLSQALRGQQLFGFPLFPCSWFWHFLDMLWRFLAPGVLLQAVVCMRPALVEQVPFLMIVGQF